jgi:transcription termination factor Rho
VKHSDAPARQTERVPAVYFSDTSDMALPPKTDDDTPSAARAASDATDTKKTRRPRTRAAKADKAEKPAKAPRGRAAKAEKTEKAEKPVAPAPEVRAEPAPTAREEAPAPRERAVERQPELQFRPEPEPQPQPRREEPREEPVARREEPAPEAPAAPERERGGESAAAAAETAPEARPQPPQRQHGGHPHPHGGGRHEGHGQPGQQGGQQGGQNREDRNFWKHGKRKRGRHGGGWQPGGGGGGREQHPQQMPPPSNGPVLGDLPNPSRFQDLAALDALANELSAGAGEPIWLNQLYALNLADLTSRVRQLGIAVDGVPNKRQLLTEVFKFVAANKRPLRDTGFIDQNDRGAFIVHEHVNYRLYPEDAYLPDALIKRYGLKRGHRIEVTLQAPLDGERCPSVVRVDSVMGMSPDDISKVTPFEELVPYYPLKRILLEDPDIVKDVSMRAVDILTPIGFGQRGLIVAPPRTGKTILLQNIANSISANSPDVKLVLLLIDERPEEVTDFRRHTKGEVVSSTFDETPESHIHCAEMVIEICRRRVEQGEHVVILLDSITRLARAYNALTSGGKTMSGGLESNALQKPKRFFGSARNIEGGGSLTIIASALIDTGSRMDEIIFEEFKGTGNSELHLDRGLVERRIFPAINIDRSGTRKEELLYHPEELQRIYALRRAMQGLGPIESMEMLITRLKKTKSNAEFLLSLAPK